MKQCMNSLPSEKVYQIKLTSKNKRFKMEQSRAHSTFFGMRYEVWVRAVKIRPNPNQPTQSPVPTSTHTLSST
jgi:hypothetical protein